MFARDWWDEMFNSLFIFSGFYLTARLNIKLGPLLLMLGSRELNYSVAKSSVF